jgi:hypothetical protein
MQSTSARGNHFLLRGNDCLRRIRVRAFLAARIDGGGLVAVSVAVRHGAVGVRRRDMVTFATSTGSLPKALL